ncbi:antibiotic biosynthesis monooxygenase [Saccharopolyspora sp. 5N708]|uniref:antibiotic biosynthesis monooxygenase n=1 Tax=Saccharopolyspora sp. 5N708 TaxID=3457424 RepID=UPI003FD111BD
MHARVGTYTGPSDALDQLARGVDRLQPELQQLGGFRGAYVLVDRDSGKAMTVTFWADEQAAKDSAEAANRMRRRAAIASGQTIQNVETYEVALQI